MSDGLILDLLRESLWSAVLVATPLLAAALVLGLVIGVLQALTSIQEMTLTFVPKVAAMGAVLWVSMDVMGETLIAFFRDRIIPVVAGG